MRKPSTEASFRALALGTLAMICLVVATPHLLAQDVRLPVVRRARPAGGYVFDRPSLVVIARVIAQVKSVVDSDDPLERLTTKRAEFWTYARAEVFQVLRVNERLPDEPDLAQGYLMLEQRDRRERPLPLELGHHYVLLLKPSPEFLPLWRPSDSQLCCLPPYAFAVPQGGFEISDLRALPFVKGSRNMIDGRLEPLAKGGPLDSYRGRQLSDLLKEIREH